MSVKVIFECGGCGATAEGTDRLRRHFRSFSGRSWGLGSTHDDAAASVVPEGWIAFDPWTYATYCPKCWAEIVEGIGIPLMHDDGVSEAPDDTQARYPGDPRGDPS